MEEKAADGALPGPKPEVVRAFRPPLDDRDAEIGRRVEQWRTLSAPGAPFDALEFAAREKADIEHAGSVPAPFAHAMAAPIPLERGRELQTCDVPTLVIQAMDDPLNPPPHGRHLADLLRNATLVEIDNLGHALPKSHLPEVFSKLAEHWKKSAVNQ
jgi:10-carbomethoxy-13-deoxycarminomycin esterase/esterase